MGHEEIPHPEEEAEKIAKGTVVERPQDAVLKKLHEQHEQHLRETVNGIEIKVGPNMEDTWELYLPGMKDPGKAILVVGWEREEGERAFAKAKELAATSGSAEELMEKMRAYAQEQMG